MNEILRSYIEDLRDSLQLLNEALMSLDQGVTDDETINRVFRVAHTIKGNSAAMEFVKVEKVMHTMEDILHEVREKKRELSPEIIKVQYRCHDFLEDFLEIVLRDGNDDKLETKDILDELLLIKDGEKKVEKAAEAPKVSESFVDEAFSSIDSELLGVIEKNIDMGMSAYKVVVNFTEDVQMKSIRAFMIFQKIEAHALIIYSNPKQPTEEDFRTGKFECDSDDLKLIIIGDAEIDYLIEEMEEDFSVADVVLSLLTKEQIHEKLKSFSATNEILEMIKYIEIGILDIQKREIKKDTVDDMLEKLRTINADAPIINSKLLAEISSKLINILETIERDNINFSPDDAQTVALLLQDMTHIAKQMNIVEDKFFLQQIVRNIELLEENVATPEERTGDILKAKGILNDDDVAHIISKQKEGDGHLKFGQVAVQEQKVSAVDMTEVLKEQQTPVSKRADKSPEAARQIRVPVTKVDNLLDMLGELIILNSQLEQQIETNNIENTTVSNTIARTAKIIRSVQDLSMSLRLIKIKNTLFRLTRIIRDTANELNKKVNIVITGDETEIDRSAAEKIFDPLMHLVRNAISHGIEMPEDRVRVGKSEEGRIEINAYSKRGHVFIEVKDDGRGIDTDKVLKKALKVGLADENTNYTEEEIVNFVMQPGFSTQVEVNHISGRGVGMNVVESELMKIGGKVEIINELGKGCNFILRIPMNLALVNGTIVDISGEKYIIPTLFIKQFFIKEEKDWISMQGHKRAIKIRNEVIPLISEEMIFDRVVERENERQQIIILEMEKKLLGLPVDNIIGRQEIVSKPLSKELSQAGILSGASILGDGKVSLVIDIEALFKLAGN